MVWETVFDSQSYKIYFSRFDSVYSELGGLGEFLDQVKHQGETVISIFPNVGTTSAAWMVNSSGVNGFVVVSHCGASSSISEWPDHPRWSRMDNAEDFRVYFTEFDNFYNEVGNIGFFMVKLEMRGERVIEIIPNIGTTSSAWFMKSSGLKGLILITRRI